MAKTKSFNYRRAIKGYSLMAHCKQYPKDKPAKEKLKKKYPTIYNNFIE